MITSSERRAGDLRFEPGLACLPQAFWERRGPTPLPDPYLVAASAEAAELFGMGTPGDDDREFIDLAAGNRIPDGATPLAAIYAGHQFGSFVPQLGDGRAITLGDVRGTDGALYEWQLKGAGMTAFSRFGDGRAVLRSTIREFLCSEAMHGLGIPTTRALAVTGSREPVYRETAETAAVLTRFAPSHVRFGSFELFHYRNQPEHVKTLADYVIDRFRPSLRNTPNPYRALLADVVERTARLLGQWQCVGFAHGVMNTDNMSILGLTLDYGPFGFLDAYDPAFICNHTDAGGRYAFDRQPTIALWNCYALAEALSTLMSTDDAKVELDRFEPMFRDAYLAGLRAKLGLTTCEDGDARLLGDLHRAMQLDHVDFTIGWRALATVTADDEGTFTSWFRDRARIAAWLEGYRARIALEDGDDAARTVRMNATNPKYVLRNHLAQTAIVAAQGGDFSEVRRLYSILRRPFDEQPEHEPYAGPPPDWAAHLEVSCSS